MSKLLRRALVGGALLTGAAACVHAAAAPPKTAATELLHMGLASTPAGTETRYNSLFRPLFGGEWSGVAALDMQTTMGDVGCSGALLSSGRHILTAAHCVTDNTGALALHSGTAYFPTLPNGPYSGRREAVNFSAVSVHPDWAGTSFLGGHDVAVITLDTVAPQGARRYDLYTGTDEVGQVHTRVGWGQWVSATARCSSPAATGRARTCTTSRVRWSTPSLAACRTRGCCTSISTTACTTRTAATARTTRWVTGWASATSAWASRRLFPAMATPAARASSTARSPASRRST